MRYTKKEAAARLGVSDSTIDRRVSDGSLNTEREAHGKTHRVWIILDDDEVDAPADGVDETVDAPHDKTEASEASTEASIELAALRERCARFEELAECRGTLLIEADARCQMLIAELASAQRTSEALARALPPAPPEALPGERRRGLLGWLRLRSGG